MAFNPVAEGLLASGSHDQTVRLWDLEAACEGAKQRLSWEREDGAAAALLDLAWSWTGSLLAMAAKDRALRLFDPRTGERPCSQRDLAHEGFKGLRVVWAGRDEQRLVSTGFSRQSDRQLALWDIRQLREPLWLEASLDQSSGLLQPWVDPDCGVLYLAGRGDGNLRFYELDTDRLHYLGEHRSTEPQRACSFLPKLACSVAENEVARCLKVHASGLLEPLSFRVPRKGEGFQADLFPPTASNTEPAIKASAWLAGERSPPLLQPRESSFTLSQELLRSQSLSAEALLCSRSLSAEGLLRPEGRPQRSEGLQSSEGRPQGPSEDEDWKGLALKLQRENAELRAQLARLQL